MTAWVAPILLLAPLSVSFGATLVVDANSEWSAQTTETYDWGSFVSIAADGTWTSGVWTGGPWGDVASGPQGGGYIMGNKLPYGLIGKFGANGEPFAVYDHAVAFVGGAGGPLFLSMNDVPGVFGDNSGSLTSQVNAWTGVQSQVVQVPADAEWSDTGISVQAGTHLLVAPTGEWTSGLWTGGPEGDGLPAPDGFIVSGEIAYSLVGRVGSDGVPFHIGLGFDGLVGASGALQLSMNDVPGIFWDNSGQLDVTVGTVRTIEPGPPCGLRGDMNGDGVVNLFDIDAFVACLTAGGCGYNGPVAHWTFNEAPGSAVVGDQSGNGHHLTLHEACALTGTALDTTAGYATTENDHDLALAGSYAVSLWVKKNFDDDGVQDTYMTMNYCTETNGGPTLRVHLSDNESLWCYGEITLQEAVDADHPPIWGCGGAGIHPACDPGWGYVGAQPVHVSAGDWIHIALVYDAMSATATVYANGVVVRSGPWVSGLAGATDAPLVLGTGHLLRSGGLCGSDSFFPGELDDVAIYNRPLHANEVHELYAGGRK